MDAVGFMSAYLWQGGELRSAEAELVGADYDSEINLAVRDLHYEMLMDLTLAPAGIEADCIRFAADEQEVWLYADGRDQRGQRLPARTNCMTSGFLLSAPQWVEWVLSLQRGELIGPESLDALNSWSSSSEALGWGSHAGQWRSHGGAYSPDGVGVRTSVVYRQDEFAASVVSNSKNAPDPSALAKLALDSASGDCP
jgi:hypothetical protein